MPDSSLTLLAGAATTKSWVAFRVARMARFGVRSGSLGRSLEEVIPHNQAV
jgi:hypothetical protein